MEPDDAQLYISTKSDDKPQVNQIEDCVKDIKDCMSGDVLLLNSDKLEILFLGPKAAKNKLSKLSLNLNSFSPWCHDQSCNKG